MPYSKNSELPKAVKKLSSKLQTLWRKVFNAAHKKYGETRAFKVAWSAVKRSREKVSGGAQEPKSEYPEPINGFITSVEHMGDNVWQAQISGPDVSYPTNMYGEVRFCPKSYARHLASAVGKPVTRNHSEENVGVILEHWVDDDGNPWLKWEMTDDNMIELMSTDEWDGGVSPSVVPSTIQEGLMVDWEFDSLGVGDGAMSPACGPDQCKPQRVDGMADNEDTLRASEAQAAKQAALKQKEAEEAAAKAAEEAVEQEELLKELKQTTTEDGFKIIEKLMEQAVKERDAELENLREELKSVTGSEEKLKEYKERKEQEEREKLISKLPEDLGVDTDGKSNDELRELVALIEKIKPEPPKAEGRELDVPEAKRGEGGEDEQEVKDKAVREYNASVKGRYTALKKDKK